MEAVAIAVAVQDRSDAIEDEGLAAQCATTTILITADGAAAVERIARRIHATSPGVASPFVRVAAAELPADAAVLAEACADLLHEARGGSLLISDVEHMPALAQDRWIETMTCLQESLEPSCRVRLIAGTTTILHHRVADCTFSERLFYRLNVIHVVATNRLGDESGATRESELLQFHASS